MLAAFPITGDDRCPAANSVPVFSALVESTLYTLTNLCFQTDGNKRKVSLGLARSLVAVSCIRRGLTLSVALAQVMLDNLQTWSCCWRRSDS